MNKIVALLFEKILLNPVTSLKNRLFFSSVGLDLANLDGSFSKELYSFYKKMIDGDVGMVIIGNSSVSPVSKLHEKGLAIYNKTHAEALRSIISYAEMNNALLVVQLQHYGAQGSSQQTGLPLFSPSGRHCKSMSKKYPDDKVTEMTLGNIIQVIDEFANAATLVKEVGGKAIQIQAGNGYLLSSFLSPYTNKRSDDYGGNEENRGRLLIEVIEEIKRRTNNELMIFVRLGIDDCFDENIGLKPQHMEYIVGKLESLGVTGVECSMCIGETFHRFLRGYDENIKKRLFDGAGLIKTFTSTMNVGCTGLVNSIQNAEYLIKKYRLDYIGMARGLLANPNLIPEYRANIIGDSCRFDGYCFRDKSNPDLDRVYCCVNPDYLRDSKIKYGDIQ